MSYVAVIPARGGSKGIKGKNLQLVGEHSLVARAILAAQKIADIKRIIVSTDDDDIAKEAEKYQAEVHKRSQETSNDSAKTIDAVAELVQDLRLNSEVCVLLQPTSPLRTSEDIQLAIDAYKSNNKGSCVTVTASEHHPFKMIVKNDDGYQPVTHLSDLEQPRQQLPQAFRINGAVYVISFKELLDNMSFFVQPQGFVEMNEYKSIDIDTHADLQRANELIKGKNL